MNGIEEQLKDAEDLTVNEIKSRLVCMDIDFDPNIKVKSYYSDLYNKAVKVLQNRKRISARLADDAMKSQGIAANRVRPRDEFKLAENEGKISKQSENGLIKINKEYTGNAINMIQKRKTIGFPGDEVVIIDEEKKPSKNLMDFLQNDNIEFNSKKVPNLIRDNLSEENLKEIKNIINITILPRKSHIIFKKKYNPYQNAYISIILVIGISFAAMLIIYSYQYRNEVNSAFQDLLRKLTESSRDQNFNRICLGFLLLLLLSYSINYHLINARIAREAYTDILEILDDIKSEPLENYISQEKLITKFSEKYEMHFLTFENEILPKIKAEAYKNKNVKIFQFNDQEIWKLK
jgi:hypothetical protein